MFKRIEIRLTGPICNCEKVDYRWGLPITKEGTGLSITCDHCGTRLEVPHSRFKGAFVLDSQNSATVLKLVPDAEKDQQ